MNCKQEWGRKILLNYFGNEFVNGEYKTHRENYLYDLEKAMLPATQLAIETKAKARAEKKVLMAEIGEINKQIEELQNKKRDLRNKFDERKGEEPPAKYIRKCPQDNCNGFLSTQWKCGLCETRVCSKCHEIKDDEHKCLEENIKSVSLLKSDTKPCPNCASLIYKIDGCDQMFCVECHVAFSWKTGKVVIGTIHNPHYYEWKRQMGTLERTEPIERNGCLLDGHFAMALINEYRYENHYDTICNVIRLIMHIREVEYPIFRQTSNETARVKFLLNRITLERFKTLIQRNNKANEKKQEILQILTIFVDVATDILISKINVKEQLENIRNYVNDCFKDISHVYNCVTYHIPSHYRILETK